MQNIHVWIAVLIGTVCAAALVGCAGTKHEHDHHGHHEGKAGAGGITKQAWGHTKEGTAVELFTLRNSKGAEAKISNYGGLVISLTAPDRNGQYADVVLGYDNI